MENSNEHYMGLALRLAEKGIGVTSPNPRVGAVIVAGDKNVGQGWHQKPGGHHAEVIALQEAGNDAAGSTMYVTLEPCSTTGKTPPCTEAIVNAQVRRVVIGSLDPNPRHSGKGIEILREAGIEVVQGALEKKCRKLNEGFEKYITRGLPFVTIKAAMSLDGKIATRTGDSKWISHETSRKRAHLMRSQADAVMVGIGTAMKDDPRLTVRLEPANARDPRKVIVDPQAEIPIDSRLLSPEIAPSAIIAATREPEDTRLDPIKGRGAEVLVCAGKGQIVDLEDLMTKLAEKGIVYILVEGGGTLIAALLEKKLVDKLAFFYAPIIIGGKDALGPVMGEGVERIGDAIHVHNISLTEIEDDILVEGYIQYERA